MPQHRSSRRSSLRAISGVHAAEDPPPSSAAGQDSRTGLGSNLPLRSGCMFRRGRAELEPLLASSTPVSTPAEVRAMYVQLGGGHDVETACRLLRPIHEKTKPGAPDAELTRLFAAISRWALAALEDASLVEPLWVPGSGPKQRSFTAAQCRGIMANVVLLNVQDPAAELKPQYKADGLRLDRRMLNSGDVGAHKMACLLQYLRSSLASEGTADDTREIVFERRTGVALDEFKASVLAAGPVPVPRVQLHEGGMEAVAADAFVNFANPIFGYGEFIASCTQEEIIQVCCPEFCVGMTFIGAMHDTEVVVVHGCRRYSAYRGYLFNFEYAGPWEGPSDVQVILTMDACTDSHFSERSVLRDIQKAALCFRGSGTVSTGRWGCGVFGGTPAHKFVQQLVGVIVGGGCHTVQFSTFGTPDGCDTVFAALSRLLPKQSSEGAGVDQHGKHVIRPGELLGHLLECCGSQPHEFVPRFLRTIRGAIDSGSRPAPPSSSGVHVDLDSTL